MDRINKVGRALIGYKSEYGKHYSPIVDESLMIALETQLEKKLLDQEIFDMIINDSISLVDFEGFIGNKREYIKSPKELMEEFEKVRAIVNEALTNINFTEFIETESNTEINKISILKQYSISEEFIKIYFGLEDVDMAQIMKKKGFAEKFAVLRLTKIFKEIFSEMRPEMEFTQGFSRVYYNPDINGFSVDYKYHLPVDFITKDNIEAKVKKIRDTDRVVERKFLKKTGISFYNLKETQNKNESLDVSKKSPNNKFTEVDVKTEEIDKIKNEVKEEQIEAKKQEVKQDLPKQKQENKQENKQEIKQENNKQKDKPQNNNQNNNQSNNKQNNKQEQNNKQNNNKQNQLKQEPPKQKEQKEKSTIKETEDYLDKDIDTEISKPENVLEIVDDISSMVVEEDYTGDFNPTNFEGFLPDDMDIETPDIDFPNIDELNGIDLSNIDMPLDEDEDDV